MIRPTRRYRLRILFFREKMYVCVDQLLRDPDMRLKHCNEKQVHLGHRNMGKTILKYIELNDLKGA